jgi:hypothetical protein
MNWEERNQKVLDLILIMSPVKAIDLLKACRKQGIKPTEMADALASLRRDNKIVEKPKLTYRAKT